MDESRAHESADEDALFTSDGSLRPSARAAHVDALPAIKAPDGDGECLRGTASLSASVLQTPQIPEDHPQVPDGYHLLAHGADHSELGVPEQDSDGSQYLELLFPGDWCSTTRHERAIARHFECMSQAPKRRWLKETPTC